MTSDGAATEVDETDRPPAVLPPLPRDEVIIPKEADAERELYGALMSGLPGEEKGELEDLMIDNIERLRSDGDSYAP
ncbi:hypothetical protein acdb102_12840 [Acidothermaceae bacterium B102]|nr:hypothetical protein acdb102_12840 [Acidothermaceae bacterium B102]